MSLKITRINLGIANCFLIDSEAGFFLVDSGLALRRKALEGALRAAGCQPSDLRLVLVTHGDLDHTGNCAYLQQDCGVKIAMHPNDAGMAEQGDMGIGRHVTGARKLIFKFSPFLLAYRPFSPDLLLNDGDDLNPWGLHARVYHLPGHSSGSRSVS
ncbi:MAG: MBL fold metallo-hydrolase [Anaerolineae bacterium]|jgi:glyoxylase-like metal-dependent hydrolase (beta-lactamase superfamily II)|nr:MBL fold metallo-hydrolase [Anaerolineae bacterium]MCZ7552571.1 MBL fold metallo-hydrolase [Anaerolineales bacterium]